MLPYVWRPGDLLEEELHRRVRPAAAAVRALY
jgi:hypothetical protein